MHAAWEDGAAVGGAGAFPFELTVPGGRVRAAGGVPPIPGRVAAEPPGMFRRSADWWDGQLLSDPQWRRRDRGEMQRALLELDGEPAGYALYRLNLSFERGSSTGELDVIEAL